MAPIAIDVRLEYLLLDFIARTNTFRFYYCENSLEQGLEEVISSICLDFQNALESYTGIPLCTRNDAILLNNAGYHLILWVSDEESAESVRRWLKNELRLKNPDKIEVDITRPSNFHLWMLQFLGFPIKVPEADFFYCSLFPGVKLSRNCKRIIRLHDPFGKYRNAFLCFFEHPAKMKLRIAKAMRTKAFVANFKDSLLVFNSNFTYQRCKSVYGDEIQGHVIHNLVQFDGLDSNESIDCSRRYLLIISGSRQRKKPEIIVNVWAESKLSDLCDLIVVGRVPDNLLSPESRNLLRLGKLEILEGVTNATLKSLTENCVASVFFSMGEGWGQPLAESVFAGKIVICNDLEVFHEVVEEFGRFFPTKAPEQFPSLAIRTMAELDGGLIDERRIKDFGKRYGIEKLTSRWIQVLEIGQ